MSSRALATVLATVATVAAGLAAPHVAHACSPVERPAVPSALAIPHDGQTIPSNGGILIAVTGPATDPERITSSVDASVSNAEGASVAGSLVMLRTDAKSVNAGTLSHSTLLFRPDQTLAPGGRYRIRASFKSSAGGSSPSPSPAPSPSTSGEIIAGLTPLQLREPTAITASLGAQTSFDSSKPKTCCAIEPSPATLDSCQGSPNGGPSSFCFWSTLTALPRVALEIDTGLSEVDSSFLEHEVFILEGGVRHPRDTEAGGSTRVRSVGVWSQPETEYCLEIVTRNLLDGTEATAKRCVPHGDLSLAAIETPGSRASLAQNLSVCTAPPSGAPALEAPWCEAHAGDERCATGSYVAADEGGGCSASGRRNPASAGTALLLALAAVCVGLRRTRRVQAEGPVSERARYD